MCGDADDPRMTVNDHEQLHQVRHNLQVLTRALENSRVVLRVCSEFVSDEAAAAAELSGSLDVTVEASGLVLAQPFRSHRGRAATQPPGRGLGNKKRPAREPASSCDLAWLVAIVRDRLDASAGSDDLPRDRAGSEIMLMSKLEDAGGADISPSAIPVPRVVDPLWTVERDDDEHRLARTARVRACACVVENGVTTGSSEIAALGSKPESGTAATRMAIANERAGGRVQFCLKARLIAQCTLKAAATLQQNSLSQGTRVGEKENAISGPTVSPRTN